MANTASKFVYIPASNMWGLALAGLLGYAAIAASLLLVITTVIGFKPSTMAYIFWYAMFTTAWIYGWFMEESIPQNRFGVLFIAKFPTSIVVPGGPFWQPIFSKMKRLPAVVQVTKYDKITANPKGAATANSTGTTTTGETARIEMILKGAVYWGVDIDNLAAFIATVGLNWDDEDDIVWGDDGTPGKDVVALEGKFSPLALELLRTKAALKMFQQVLDEHLSGDEKESVVEQLNSDPIIQQLGILFDEAAIQASSFASEKTKEIMAGGVIEIGEREQQLKDADTEDMLVNKHYTNLVARGWPDDKKSPNSVTRPEAEKRALLTMKKILPIQVVDTGGGKGSVLVNVPSGT